MSWQVTARWCIHHAGCKASDGMIILSMASAFDRQTLLLMVLSHAVCVQPEFGALLRLGVCLVSSAMVQPTCSCTGVLQLA